MNENVKFLYEKAISAYEASVKKAEYKLDLSTLFVAVLFVVYFLLSGKCFSGTSILIDLLGLTASICALYAFRGRSAWQKSWGQILQYHEELFLKEAGLSDKNRLYSLVAGNGKFYSSKKITELLYGCVISAWVILLFKDVFYLSMKVIFFGFACGGHGCGAGKFSLVNYCGYYHCKLIMIYLAVVLICVLALIWVLIRNRNTKDYLTDISYIYKLEKTEDGYSVKAPENKSANFNIE